MIKLPEVPYGRTAIELLYGDPYDPDFRSKHLATCTLPYFMVLSWMPDRAVQQITVHRLVLDSLQDALQEVVDLVGEEKLHEMSWDRWGGCYNIRPKTHGKEPSTHSWGISIDLNPHLGPYGRPAPGYPKVFIVAFESRGWIWGGRWRTPDPMHFQAARGY